MINEIFYYKERPYRVKSEGLYKSEAGWIAVIVYESLYETPCKCYVRQRDEFLSKFSRVDAELF